MNFRNNLSKLIGTALGLGYAPIGPGTVGSIGGLLVALFIFHFSTIPNVILIGLIVVFTLLGIISANRLEKIWGEDPSKVVIDEVVGMWISLLFLPHTLIVVTISFLLFRVFDISKPLYIRNMERLNGGYGVMMDDILAGIYTNVILQVIVVIYKLF